VFGRLEGELAHQVGVAGVAEAEVSVGIDMDDLERCRELSSNLGSTSVTSKASTAARSSRPSMRDGHR
jgi:hypothetical protein